MRGKTDDQLRALIHNKSSGVASALASQEADRRGLALGRAGVHVQGHGLHPSTRADAIRPGHTRVFNGPSHAEVTKVEHKGSMVHITTRDKSGKEYTQKHHGATHLAVVKPRADQPPKAGHIDQAAVARGHVGTSDPAALAKQRSDAELRHIAESNPNTPEAATPAPNWPVVPDSPVQAAPAPGRTPRKAPSRYGRPRLRKPPARPQR